MTDDAQTPPSSVYHPPFPELPVPKWLKERVDQHSIEISELKGDFKVIRSGQEQQQKTQMDHHSVVMESIGGLRKSVETLQNTVQKEKLETAYHKGRKEGAEANAKFVIPLALTCAGLLVTLIFNILKAAG